MMTADYLRFRMKILRARQCSLSHGSKCAGMVQETYTEFQLRSQPADLPIDHICELMEWQFRFESDLKNNNQQPDLRDQCFNIWYILSLTINQGFVVPISRWFEKCGSTSYQIGDKNVLTLQIKFQNLNHCLNLLKFQIICLDTFCSVMYEQRARMLDDSKEIYKCHIFMQLKTDLTINIMRTFNYL